MAEDEIPDFLKHIKNAMDENQMSDGREGYFIDTESMVERVMSSETIVDTLLRKKVRQAFQKLTAGIDRINPVIQLAVDAGLPITPEQARKHNLAERTFTVEGYLNDPKRIWVGDVAEGGLFGTEGAEHNIVVPPHIESLFSFLDVHSEIAGVKEGGIIVPSMYQLNDDGYPTGDLIGISIETESYREKGLGIRPIGIAVRPTQHTMMIYQEKPGLPSIPWDALEQAGNTHLTDQEHAQEVAAEAGYNLLLVEYPYWNIARPVLEEKLKPFEFFVGALQK